MDKHARLARIFDSGVIAIVRLDSADQLLRVAEAIMAGGVNVIEFTMTTPGALDVIRKASDRFGDEILLGVGTVLDSETAREAILAGARFVVTPTLRHETIELCNRYSAPICAGAYTPTEILSAWEWGADLVKVFPATSLGPGYIRDVLAPLPQIRLVPTGGVSKDNVEAFILAGAAAVAVGSSLVDRTIVAAGDWATLTANAKAFSEAVQAAREPTAGSEQGRGWEE